MAQLKLYLLYLLIILHQLTSYICNASESCDITHVSFKYGVTFYKGKHIYVNEIGKIQHGENLWLSCLKMYYELYIDGKVTTFDSSDVYCSHGILSGTSFQCLPGRCKCDQLQEKLVDKKMEATCNDIYIPNGQKVHLKCSNNSTNRNTITAECSNKRWQINNNITCIKELSSELKLENVTLEEASTIPNNNTGIKLNITRRKPTLYSAVKTLLTTFSVLKSTPTIKLPVFNLSRNQITKCKNQTYDHNMSIFINGYALSSKPAFFNQNTGLKFRCEDPIYFKLNNNSETFCLDGKWKSAWPKCVPIQKNSDNSPPPIAVSSDIGTPDRLDNGDYYLSKNTYTMYFACYYGKHQPIMILNGINVKNNPYIAQFYYNNRLNAWVVKTVPSRTALHLSFTCEIPNKSSNYSNSVTIRFGDKCKLNEVKLSRKYSIGVIPYTRRFPYYIEGDNVLLRCAQSAKNITIPNNITCGSGGHWIKSQNNLNCL